MLSERQRSEAIQSCERIQELLARQRHALLNMQRILDNCANGRNPNEGIKTYEESRA